jgi:predicted secreted Zn-dependent protease
VLRMARDVAVMFDEMKALADRHAEMHADRARLAAELEQARRPWWRRVIGR